MRKRRSGRLWIIEDNPGPTIKEAIEMKGRKGLKSWICVMLMAVTAVGMIVLLTHEPVKAAVTDPCVSYSKTKDSDGDGFSDYDECNGIIFAGQAQGTFFGLKDRGSLDRSQYLDPNTLDLFVVLVPKAGGYFSLLPSTPSPLEFLSNPRGSGGLGIAVHLINANQVATSPDRKVCSNCQTGFNTQKALRITESLDISNPKILGSSPSQHGNPNQTDTAVVYTERIKDSLELQCGCTDILNVQQCNDCCDNATPQACGSALFYKYIKHSIVHEIGHQIMLTTTKDANWNWHYPEDTGVELDYQVHATGKTFHLGTTFTSTDQSGFKLK
jgi:hypothetical protein